MKHCSIIFALLISIAISINGFAASNPELLLLFDKSRDSVELEVENQAAHGCFLNPYELKAIAREQLEQLGFRIAPSSPFVLSLVSWGVASDEHHCAVVLESGFRKYAVKVQLNDERMISTELSLWQTLDMLTGPNMRLQERVCEKLLQQLHGFDQAVSGAPQQ